jgi:hypothetical protein
MYDEYALGAHSLDQKLKDYSEKNHFFSCPVEHIEQSKCIKLTIETNIQFTMYKALHLYRRAIENSKTF